ncbi:MAG: phosphoribosylformylglycinamidine cyclo-ligase [Dehalococcoidia bacterium]|nr:phosphoribosylformylglycinamidine cyclo-ligase [Dehalococcoidia bacterium]
MISNHYTQAGVDIGAADTLKKDIARLARVTLRPEVLAGPGLFGGMFELKGFTQPVLVSSMDGVGTKLKLAVTLDRLDTVGIDIVNHSVNDILTCGATPLFFLDYIAMGHLKPEAVREIVKGLSSACQDVSCTLIGGETAEMPGLYAGSDFDLVGCIIGAVEKSEIINGQTITPGDIILGLPSSGLHTNGYSLVRRVLGEGIEDLGKYHPELGMTLGEALLIPHRSYLKELKSLLTLVKGMAHITGGGFPGNVPRVLPENTAARFDAKAWEIPPLFRLIESRGGIARDEMYRVFNMGIGIALIAAPDDAYRLKERLPEAMIIGEIVRLQGSDRVVFD